MAFVLPMAMLETVASTVTMALVGLGSLAVGAAGVSGFFSMFDGCHSQLDTTRLVMGKAAQRVEIYTLRKHLPTQQEGLQVVFPDGLPRDSWDNELVYVTPGPNGKLFDLISLGADGQRGGEGNDADLRYSDGF